MGEWEKMVEAVAWYWGVRVCLEGMLGAIREGGEGGQVWRRAWEEWTSQLLHDSGIGPHPTGDAYKPVEIAQ